MSHFRAMSEPFPPAQPVTVNRTSREGGLIVLLIVGCAAVWLGPWFAWQSYEPWDGPMALLYPVAMVVLGFLFALLSRLPSIAVFPAAWAAGFLGQSAGACLVPGHRTWVPLGLIALSVTSCLLLLGARGGLWLSRSAIAKRYHG